MATEQRLIDANILETRIRNSAKVEVNDTNYDIGRVHGLINAADLIKNAPTVDAIEVVRCKDCDYRVFDDVCKEYYCNCVYGMYGAIADNDFCSYGERRSPENE